MCSAVLNAFIFAGLGKSGQLDLCCCLMEYMVDPVKIHGDMISAHSQSG